MNCFSHEANVGVGYLEYTLQQMLVKKWEVDRNHPVSFECQSRHNIISSANHRTCPLAVKQHPDLAEVISFFDVLERVSLISTSILDIY